MKITVITTRGNLTVDNFDEATVLDMLDAYRDPNTVVLDLQMDEAMVYLNRAAIVRIDVE